LKDQVVLRVIAKLTVPFMIVLGAYIITHGETGPGGGFQGGVIVAAGFILYGLVYGKAAMHAVLPQRLTDFLAAFGVLLYAGTGVWCMVRGGRFLDYAVLPGPETGAAEALGMTLVEYGVGITVATVMITIYDMISEREDVRA